MAEKSRAKLATEELYKIPYIRNIRWNLPTEKVYVYLNEDIPDEFKDNIRKIVHRISDKYEVVFEVVKKKSRWQRFLDSLERSLERSFGNYPPPLH